MSDHNELILAALLEGLDDNEVARVRKAWELLGEERVLRLPPRPGNELLALFESRTGDLDDSPLEMDQLGKVVGGAGHPGQVDGESTILDDDMDQAESRASSPGIFDALPGQDPADRGGNECPDPGVNPQARFVDDAPLSGEIFIWDVSSDEEEVHHEGAGEDTVLLFGLAGSLQDVWNSGEMTIELQGLDRQGLCDAFTEKGDLRLPAGSSGRLEAWTGRSLVFTGVARISGH